jgi:hypothetical protein
MVSRKKTIPPQVDVGNFVGINAIPSGTIYAGQLLSVVGAGNKLGGDYTPSTNLAIPIAKAILAADVTASGVLRHDATNPQSGSGLLEFYKIIGVAAAVAPIQDSYQQLGVGKPIVDPTNVTQYTYTYDTDIRRFAIITENDPVVVWLPFTGTDLVASDIGKYLTLSASIDGCVAITADAVRDITVGQILGFSTDTSFMSGTVPGVDAYVKTRLCIR